MRKILAPDLELPMWAVAVLPTAKDGLPPACGTCPIACCAATSRDTEINKHSSWWLVLYQFPSEDGAMVNSF